MVIIQYHSNIHINISFLTTRAIVIIIIYMIYKSRF